MKPEDNDTGNVVEFQARDSAKRDLQASSGEDEAETRQDLVVVALTRGMRDRAIGYIRAYQQHLRPIAALGVVEVTEMVADLAHLRICFEESQPSPDQGEHVAPRKEGECLVCVSCGGGEWHSYPGSDVRYCTNPHCPTAVETSA